MQLPPAPTLSLLSLYILLSSPYHTAPPSTPISIPSYECACSSRDAMAVPVTLVPSQAEASRGVELHRHHLIAPRRTIASFSNLENCKVQKDTTFGVHRWDSWWSITHGKLTLLLMKARQCFINAGKLAAFRLFRQPIPTYSVGRYHIIWHY